MVIDAVVITAISTIWFYMINSELCLHSRKMARLLNRLDFHSWLVVCFDPRSHPAQLRPEKVTLSAIVSSSDIEGLVTTLNAFTKSSQVYGPFQNRNMTLTWQANDRCLTIYIQHGTMLTWTLPGDTCMIAPHTFSLAEWRIERVLRDFCTNHKTIVMVLSSYQFWLMWFVAILSLK